MYQYRAKVLRVIDGDTCELEIDLGFHLTYKSNARLELVNTPEKGVDRWAEAKEMFAIELDKVKDKDGYIIITTSKPDKYGRVLFRCEQINETMGRIWPYDK